MSRDDLDINAQDYDVRNEEMTWNLSPNNFLFRAKLYYIWLARIARVALQSIGFAP